MPTGTFHSVPILSITVNRTERQRRDLGDLSSLTDSIRRLGLIHPPVVTRDDHILIAGERRLTACTTLGWDRIPVQYEDETDPRILKLVELEENTRRRDLTWTEINDATVEAYAVHKDLEPDATDETVANYIGMSKGNLSDHLLVKRERVTDGRIDDNATFRTAIDRTRAAVARRDAAALADVYTVRSSNDIYTPIIHANFHTWAPAYSGPPFDVIHCDFPYGIDADASGVNPAGYDDSIFAFKNCCTTLIENIDRLASPAAHIIFWYSQSNIDVTIGIIRRLSNLAGFTFDQHPLIWHKSDGMGIAPDSNRRPRRVYETAFFGYRNRALVALRDNLVAAPSTGMLHPHEKPEVALRYFFEMVVDANTTVLDPTCGSGSALRAARSLGATRVLGLEANADYARDALAAFAA